MKRSKKNLGKYRAEAKFKFSRRKMIFRESNCEK